MRWVNRMAYTRRGIVLIMVAAVLAILSALGTGFYTMMVMQTKSATHYSDMVRAESMAHAGVSFAIANLRQQAFKKTEDPSDPWFMVDYLNGAKKGISYADSPLLHNGVDDDGDGVIDNIEEGKRELPYSRVLGSTAGPSSDRFTLAISDAASKINVNACDNLAVVLDNLCRVIGPPLVPADQDMIYPRVWEWYGGPVGKNPKDWPTSGVPGNLPTGTVPKDLYYTLDPAGRPVQQVDGSAVYGDGYAIAGYRAQHGIFQNIDDVKNALTYVERNGNNIPDDPLEQLEIEVKFAALRDYITVASYVDTNTVCVGKFEWVFDVTAGVTVAIDRDKSWVSSVDSAGKHIPDTLNTRGTLCGSYVSIINGHGAGQLRRILENGVDWIQVDPPTPGQQGFAIKPGPTSSYMIIAREDALLVDSQGKDVADPPPPSTLTFPKTDATGALVDNPNIDYARYPLCIHRAPVNLNTASDKVLAALFMGLNVQAGHYLSIGTNSSTDYTALDGNLPAPGLWKIPDPHMVESYLLTPQGLKRVPLNQGKIIFDRPMPAGAISPQFDYLNNYGLLDPAGTKSINEAQELAWRIIVARQIDPANPNLAYIDPVTGNPVIIMGPFKRGPFTSWDDLYFRVVKPWDDQRTLDPKRSSVAPMIMANFNSNTDILKFNPNIEWIDRWGRNFTEMEPVMAYSPTNPLTAASTPVYSTEVLSCGIDGPVTGDYVTRSFRYKSDEMIDKTDLNRSTTEFCFDSGGIYEIDSVGQVVSHEMVQSERRLNALVQVYSVWRESTQRQFVQGTINAPPGMGAPGAADSGQIVRDGNPANNGKSKITLPLVTLPEPLVPLQYTINNPNGIADVVDVGAPTGRDAWGQAKQPGMPDIVANHVLPAGYDGQISLAPNTAKFDPINDKDTFLASFNGDLDTDTSSYNGREQAKTPTDCKTRVVDTIGLLGALNDTFVDQDPTAHQNYRFATIDSSLVSLNTDYYSNNCTVRMGDLRTDGVYLSGPGCSGNDATLKYLTGAIPTRTNAPEVTPLSNVNMDPASPLGNVMSMWMKPTWHHNDNRTHEFFNGCNPGSWWNARQLFLKKHGRFCWAVADDAGGSGLSGTRARNNDLMFCWEGVDSTGGVDRDVDGHIHGGTNRVVSPRSPYGAPPATLPESPGYRVQPFRWHFVGARWNYHFNDINYQLAATNGGSRGLWVTQPVDLTNHQMLTWYVRPFINTQRDAEGPSWNDRNLLSRNAMYHGWMDLPSDLQTLGAMDKPSGTTGQPVKWDWADPAGVTLPDKCFGVNNLNYDNDVMIYRNLPEEGTYAVIDELKISSKDSVLWNTPDWTKDRITRQNNGEMTTSRYYLPQNCGIRSQCPAFTSQTLLQSVRGFASLASGESVTLVRVTWTAFTPRFMHEYKMASGLYSRTEYHTYNMTTATTETVPFNGPFDYETYNWNESYAAVPAAKLPFSVYRPSPPALPKQSHATKGIEIELLNGAAQISGYENSTGSFLATTYFSNPDVINRFGNPLTDTYVNVNPDGLRYRVIFRYPVDPTVDPSGGQPGDNLVNNVDPTTQYMLDTPIFDDISVTYLTQPRILSYKEVLE